MAMVKFTPNDFDTVFTIDLLPTVVSSDDLTYTVESGETFHYTNNIVAIISNCAPSNDAKLDLIEQLHLLEIHGGIFASLSQYFDYSEFAELEGNHFSISLNHEIEDAKSYIHEKKIRFLISGMPLVVNNEKMEDVQKHCTELIHQIFKNFLNRIKLLKKNEQFVNQLFTDASVTIDEKNNEEFIVKFNPSLKEYLLTLSQRL